MDRLTIHDACAGKFILLTDPDLGLVFAWNGSVTFTVYCEEKGRLLRECDGWTTDVRPAGAEEARDRCRERLDLIRREDEGALPRAGA